MIIQTNTWICDKCEKIRVDAVEVSIYDDPVVTPPQDTHWREDAAGKLLCPTCKE